MVEVKVGQTIKINAAIWDFCGTTIQAISINGVGINTLPALDPDIKCQAVSGIGVTFKLVSTLSSVQCHQCNPAIIQSILGTAYSDSRGLATLEYTVTDLDYASYMDAFKSGNTKRILACITDSKGQQILQSECSETITILPMAEPGYVLTFNIFEHLSGILDTLSHYTPMITAAINRLIPDEAGWVIARTEVDPSKAAVMLYLTETGSWAINEIATFLLIAFNLAVAAIFFILFPPPLNVILGVAALIILGWGVTRLIDKQSVLKELVTNFETKDQNDTRLDQMVAQVLAEYEKSAKTKDDCLNKLNGLKISYTTYMDTMQKDFKTLYTPAIKRTFESTADTAIEQFKAGTMTCEQASEKILTQGAVAKADVSTNFTTVYNVYNPYQPPKKEECWVSKPFGEEGCILSASTGKWIAGSIAFIGILGTAYWFATRKPAETKLFLERAKKTVTAEAERAKAAFREIRAPQAPRIRFPEVPM